MVQREKSAREGLPDKAVLQARHWECSARHGADSRGYSVPIKTCIFSSAKMDRLKIWRTEPYAAAVRTAPYMLPLVPMMFSKLLSMAEHEPLIRICSHLQTATIHKPRLNAFLSGVCSSYCVSKRITIRPFLAVVEITGFPRPPFHYPSDC